MITINKIITFLNSKVYSFFENDTASTKIPCCDKKDCIRYSNWKISDKVPSVWKLPEKWNKDSTELSYTFTDCAICVHFKGFDLYRQITDLKEHTSHVNI